MAGKGAAAAAGKAGEGDAAAKAAEEAAAAKVAEEAAAAAGKTADDDDDDAGKGKKSKTFTEAEVKAREKAAAIKAEADAKKKFEEEKDLSETERLKKENDDLRAANRLRDAKDTVLEALKDAKNPELLWKAVKGDLDFADDGKIKNLDALVKGLKEDYVDQFGEAKPGETIDGGAGQQAKPTGGLTKEKLAKMAPKEIQALDWEDVKKVMAAD
ncbi:MAG TPA: hypothetical protein VGO43_13650 [Pyrinomonadaceae bacterium]|jgi:hypothetical protein|nr:hypothetical protein [Pyrinomonadaceae bacterium]